MFNKIIAFLRSIPIGYWIISGGVFILVIVAGYILMTYSIVSIVVNYNNGIPKEAKLFTVGVNRDDEPTTPSIGGFYFIRHDTSALKASTNNYSTIKNITEPKNGDTLTINLYRDKNATKYSSANPGCFTYSKKTDRLLSYNCTKPTQLSEYVSSGSMPNNKSIATIAQIDTNVYTIKPFQGGVTGIRMPRFVANIPTNKFLFKIDENGKESTSSVPDNITQEQLNATNVITDTTTESNDSILLVSKQNSSLFYKDSISNTTNSYKNYKLPDNFSPTFDALSCQLLATMAYCYYGPNSDPSDSQTQTQHRTNEKKGTIVTVDFSDETPAAQTYTIADSTPLDTLSVTQGGNLYGMSYRDLMSIELSGSSATLKPFVVDSGSVSTSDGIYFVRDNSVYKYDDTKNESYLVFHSDKLRISTVTSLNGETFVNAYTQEGSGQRIHTYKINDEPNMTPGTRLIDVLPLDFKDSPDISDMDYYKNNLYIRVKVTVKKTGRSTGLDQAAFNESKKRIEQLLKDRNINTETLTINYSY